MLPDAEKRKREDDGGDDEDSNVEERKRKKEEKEADDEVAVAGSPLFATLPIEIYLEVFRQTGARELAVASNVCRKFRKVASFVKELVASRFDKIREVARCARGIDSWVNEMVEFGGKLVFGTEGEGLRSWSLEDEKARPYGTSRAITEGLGAEGGKLFVATHDVGVMAYDEGGNHQMTLRSNELGWLTDLCFVGRYVYAGLTTSRIVIWNLAKAGNDPLLPFATGPFTSPIHVWPTNTYGGPAPSGVDEEPGGIRVTCLCPLDGDGMIRGGDSRGNIFVWDDEGYAFVARWKAHDRAVMRLCEFDRNLVSCSADGYVKSWHPAHRGDLGPERINPRALGHLSSVFGKHDDSVYALCVFEEEFLASGSFDKTIKIWNVLGECLKTFVAHAEGIHCLCVYRGMIASGGRDNTIKLWNV